jgi:hypothetical protein
MKALFVTTMIVAATLAAQVNAETFTSQIQPIPESTVRVGAPLPDGSPLVGTFTRSNVTTTFADGRKETGTTTCVLMTQPEHDSIFTAHRVCDVTLGDGTYTSVSGCNYLNKDMTDTSCVGGLIGKTGAYAGRQGNYSTSSISGKTVIIGQWFDK